MALLRALLFSIIVAFSGAAFASDNLCPPEDELIAGIEARASAQYAGKSDLDRGIDNMERLIEFAQVTPPDYRPSKILSFAAADHVLFVLYEDECPKSVYFFSKDLFFTFYEMISREKARERGV